MIDQSLGTTVTLDRYSVHCCTTTIIVVGDTGRGMPFSI